MFTARTVLTAAALSLSASAYAGPSLVGDTVEIWGTPQLNGVSTLRDTVAVTDPGIEFVSEIPNVSTLYTVDVRASQIVILSETDWFSPWFNSGHAPSSLEVRDMDIPGQPVMGIVDIAVRFSDTITVHDSSPFNHPEFSTDNFSFTSDSVRWEYGGYAFADGTRIQIDLTFGPVPSVGTPLIAIAGLGVLGRRRR